MKTRTLVAAAALLASACASEPVTRYYLLAAAAPAPAPAESRNPVSVVIKDVRLPQYLDRPQIVTRGSEHRLVMADYELWAGDLRQDMLRVLSENLRRWLATERVVVAPHTLKAVPDVRVEIEVLRFERDPGGKVELAARWWLTRGTDGQLISSPSITLAGAQLAAGAPYEAIVASMSMLYAQLAREIARSIQARGPGGE